MVALKPGFDSKCGIERKSNLYVRKDMIALQRHLIYKLRLLTMSATLSRPGVWFFVFASDSDASDI